MWVILECNRNSFINTTIEIYKKINKSTEIYRPKILVEKKIRQKIFKKYFYPLSNYFFCYDTSFNDTNKLNNLKFITGIKKVLFESVFYQDKVTSFIQSCKNQEDSKGNLKNNFFELFENNKYKFLSGPFLDQVFKIILKKKKLNILIGNINIKVNKEKYSFRPE